MKNILQNIRETEFLFHKTDETIKLENLLKKSKEEDIRFRKRIGGVMTVLILGITSATAVAIYEANRIRWQRGYISEVEQANQSLRQELENKKEEYEAEIARYKKGRGLFVANTENASADGSTTNTDLRNSVNLLEEENSKLLTEIDRLRSEHKYSSEEFDNRIKEYSQSNLSLRNQLETKKDEEERLKREKANLESLLSQKDQKIQQLEDQLRKSYSNPTRRNDPKPDKFDDISHLPYFAELVTEDQKAAERMFQECLKKEPKDIQNGNFAPLIDQYKSALEKDPLNPRIKLHLAKCIWLGDKPWYWDGQTWRIEAVKPYLRPGISKSSDKETDRKASVFFNYLEYIKTTEDLGFNHSFGDILLNTLLNFDLQQDSALTIEAKALLLISSELEDEAKKCLEGALQFNHNNREAKPLLEILKNRNPYYESETRSIFSQRDTFPDYCR